MTKVTNLVSLARNIQIQSDRDGNNNKVYGDIYSEKEAYQKTVKAKLDNGEISEEDFKKLLDYVNEPFADHWQPSSNKEAEKTLNIFKEFKNLEDVSSELKEYLGNEVKVISNRDWARPIVAYLQDGTEVTYNRIRDELRYKNNNETRYYYFINDKEFTEEIK